MMIYNVWIERNGKILLWNVFSHTSFRRACEDYICGKVDKHDLRRELAYYFWSKCEYEVVICGWPNTKTEEKIDVHDQLLANWDVFLGYLDKQKKIKVKVKIKEKGKK